MDESQLMKKINRRSCKKKINQNPNKRDDVNNIRYIPNFLSQRQLQRTETRQLIINLQEISPQTRNFSPSSTDGESLSRIERVESLRENRRGGLNRGRRC